MTDLFRTVNQAVNSLNETNEISNYVVVVTI